MIKILKGSRFAVISHRFQQLIPILIWVFRIFSNSRTIMIRSKSTEWKASYSNNQTIGHKKKRGCWFTHFTMKTVNLSYQLCSHYSNSTNGIMVVEWQIGERSRAEIVIFGFGFFCFDSEIVIFRVWVWVVLLRSWDRYFKGRTGLSYFKGRRVERTAAEKRKKENAAGEKKKKNESPFLPPQKKQ